MVGGILLDGFEGDWDDLAGWVWGVVLLYLMDVVVGRLRYENVLLKTRKLVHSLLP